MISQIATFHFKDIREGMEFTHRYKLGNTVYALFLETFGDVNPVHTDDSFARTKGFKAKIMHGAILNGFVSHFVGVIFPGKEAVLLSAKLDYLHPVYLEETVELKAQVIQVVPSLSTLIIRVVFYNLSRKCNVARGEVCVSLKSSW